MSGKDHQAPSDGWLGVISDGGQGSSATTCLHKGQRYKANDIRLVTREGEHGVHNVFQYRIPKNAYINSHNVSCNKHHEGSQNSESNENENSVKPKLINCGLVYLVCGAFSLS